MPRRAKDLQHTVKVAVNELGQMLGRSPTVEEIAGQAGVPVEEVLEALEAGALLPQDPPGRHRATTGVDDLSPTWARSTGRLDAVDAPPPSPACWPSCPPASAASSSCATWAD